MHYPCWCIFWALVQQFCIEISLLIILDRKERGSYITSVGREMGGREKEERRGSLLELGLCNLPLQEGLNIFLMYKVSQKFAVCDEIPMNTLVKAYFISYIIAIDLVKYTGVDYHLSDVDG